MKVADEEGMKWRRDRHVASEDETADESVDEEDEDDDEGDEQDADEEEEKEEESGEGKRYCRRGTASASITSRRSNRAYAVKHSRR